MDGFPRGHAYGIGIEEDGMTAKLRDADLKRHAGPQRRTFKDHRSGLTGEWLMDLAAVTGKLPADPQNGLQFFCSPEGE
jgi:hypothetical protein